MELEKLKHPSQLKNVNFSCGNEYFDNFLFSDFACDNSAGMTYLWFTEDRSHLIGFFNITAGDLEYTDSEQTDGCVHINYFAVAEEYQRTVYVDDMLYSDYLLSRCLLLAEQLRDNYIGISSVTLSATEDGYNLYKRNEFEELEPDMHFSANKTESECIRMYYILDEID